MTRGRIAFLLLALLLAVGSGVVIAVMALAMSGGGDGWNSAFISASAVITAPAGALIWFGRGRRFARVAAILLTIVNVAILAFLVHESIREAMYVARVWDSMPWMVTLWAALWMFWLALPVVVAARTRV